MATTGSATPSISCKDCDRAFRWKPDLAGKRVKCKCGGRIQFPDQAPARSTTNNPKAKTKSKPKPAEDEGFNPFDDALDALAAQQESVKVEPVAAQSGAAAASPTGSTRCPMCRAVNPADAMLCENCDTALVEMKGSAPPKPASRLQPGSGKNKKRGGRKAKGKASGKDMPGGGRSATGGIRMSRGLDTTSKREITTGVKVAGFGMLIHILGYFAAFFCMILLVISVAAAASASEDPVPQNQMWTVAMTASLPLFALCISLLACFVGPLLAFAAPNDAGRGNLIGTVVCVVLGIGLPIGFAMGVDPEFVAKYPRIRLLVSIPMLLLMAGAVGFVLKFLVDFTAYIEDGFSHGWADFMLGIFFVLLLIQFVVGAVSAIPTVGPIVLAIAAIPILLINVVMSIAYMVVCLRAGWVAMRA